MTYYEAVVEGGIEGLELPDLLIKVNGSLRTVKVKKGEFVPVDLIDPKMFIESKTEGSLMRSMKAGWIVEKVSGVNVPVEAEVNKVEETKVNEPEVESDPNKVRLASVAGGAAIEIAPPIRPVMPTERATAVDKVVIPEPPKFELKVTGTADLTKISALNDFKQLATGTKIRFIEGCLNLALLKEIFDSSNWGSVKIAVRNRLKELNAWSDTEIIKEPGE